MAFKLSNIMNLAQGAAGIMSMIPFTAPVAGPIAMGLGLANNFIPEGGDKVKPTGTDITSLYKTNNPGNSKYVSSNEINKGFYNSGNTYNRNLGPMQDKLNQIIPYGGSAKLNPSAFGQPGIPDPEDASIIQPAVAVQNSVLNTNQGYNTNFVPDYTKEIENIDPNLLNPNQIINPKSTDVISPEAQALLDKGAGIDSTVKGANIYSGISSGITGLASIGSLINELNKKPSEMMISPQYKTTKLDSNQSAYINNAEDKVSQSKNAQGRLLRDLGVDPAIASTILNNSANSQLLGAYAEAERTRQSIEGSEAQINASIQAQANQTLAQTKQFNIQKQMTENQMASQNIGQSIMSLAGSISGFGGSKLSNQYWGKLMKTV